MKISLMAASIPSIVVVVLLCSPVQAQWAKVPVTKPNMSGPAPREADGKPDLSGAWEPVKSYVGSIAADLKEAPPYQPATNTMADQRKTGAHTHEDRPAHCLHQGSP